jgi:DNA-binding protein HU-beta
MSKKTKAQLIEMVKDKIADPEMSSAKAKICFNAVVDTIVEELVAGNSVGITGLGSFLVKDVGPKTGTVPGTDKKYSNDAKRVVKFKATPALKNLPL